MRVRLTKPADKKLNRLPNDVAEKIRGAIRALAADPASGTQLKCNSDLWSYRAGRSYRIIYQFSRVEVIVRTIGHRRDVYRSV